jgi:uncharacterized protein YbaP (TraB family)
MQSISKIHIYKSASLFFLLILIGSYNTMFSQNREEYQLLWQIEHKNSDKKSYVFGTMHVKDKRVFDFSDALMPAIQNSEAFALEVHPDSISDSFGKTFYKQTDENIYKRILSPKEYERLNDKFKQINGVSLDSFSLKNPMIIESMLTEDSKKKDDKDTFLDAYLYAVANSLDREILGLEKAQDQIPLIKDLDDETIRENILDLVDTDTKEYHNYLNELTQLYYQGNIDKILLKAHGFGTIDSVLIKRNRVMVNSLMNIMADKTVFAAVGTAHLPGKYGILELMRDEGYKVSMVENVFTGKSNNFKIKANLKKWYSDNNDELGYHVLIPTKPTPINYENTFNMLVSTDIISGGTFAYMALDLRGQEIKEEYNFVEEFIKNQTKNNVSNLLERSIVKKDGVEFTEVIYKKNDVTTRIQLAFVNKIVYAFFVENKLSELKSDYINSYFDSVKVFPPKVVPLVWEEVENPAGAYSILFPKGKVIDNSQTVDNPLGEDEEPYNIKLYLATDVEQKMNYLLRYNDQPLGYYLQNENASLEEFKNLFEGRGKIIGDLKPITIEGYEGFEFEALLNDKFHTVGRFFFRGNRIYLLLAQKTEVDSKADASKFFNSFKLKEYKPTKFDSVVKVNNDTYSFSFPKQQKKVNINEYDATMEIGENNVYYAYSEQSGGAYLVDHSILNEYFKIETLDKFYDQYIENIKEWNDTIVKNEKIVIDGLPAREVFYKNPENKIIQKLQFLLDNNNLFILQAYLGEEEMKIGSETEFFKSFKKLKQGKEFDVYASKASKLLRSLQSKDSIIFEKAYGAFNYYIFDKSERALLEKALAKKYKDDTLYDGVKNKIIKELGTVGNEGTLKLLEKMYLNKSTENVQKLAILEAIPELKTTQAYATYFDLLNNYPPQRNKDIPFYVVDHIGDSLVDFSSNVDKIVPLLAKEIYRDEVVSYFKNKLFYDSLNSDKVKLYAPQILKNVQVDAKRYADSINREKYEYVNYMLLNSYIDIIDSLKIVNPQTEEALKTLYTINEKDNWIKSRALFTAVKLNIDVDKSIIQKSFNDLYSRFEIIEVFIKSGKTEEIPKEYIAPEAFAKLSLYNNIGYYDGYPDYMEMLGTIKQNEKDYFVYSYSYSTDEETKYLGISENKEVNLKKFEQNTSYFDWDEVEENWEEQAKQLLLESISAEETIED